MMLNQRRSRHVREMAVSWHGLLMTAASIAAVCAVAACADVESRTVSPQGNIPTGGQPVYPGTPVGPVSPVQETYFGYYDEPIPGNHYVYSLNPSYGSVTVINALTMSMRVVETGPRPLFMERIPGTDNAIVLNTGADDLTLIEIDAADAITTTKIDVISGANRIRVTPDGAHALVYYDAERNEAGTEFGDFQTVSVLDLTKRPVQTYEMTVGFKPRDVYFNLDASVACVVTDDGVSLLNFAQIGAEGSGIAEQVKFATGNFSQETEAFVITPDGEYAVFKKRNKQELHQVSLRTGEETVLELSGFFRTTNGAPDWNGVLEKPVSISDIQFSRDAGMVTLVEINSKNVLQIPVPEGIVHPRAATLIPIVDMVPERVLYVPASERLVVYRLDPTSEEMVVVDMTKMPTGNQIPGANNLNDTDSSTDSDTDSDTLVGTDSGADTPTAQPDTDSDTALLESAIQYIPLRKGISQVSVSEDGNTAVISHSRVTYSEPLESLSVEQRIDASFGYSLVDLESYDVKLQLTETQPSGVVNISGKNVALLLFRDERSVHQASLASFVVAPMIELESPPLSAGLVSEAGRVFINQEHSEGRVSFWDLESGDISTVTGFVLNSSIKD